MKFGKDNCISQDDLLILDKLCIVFKNTISETKQFDKYQVHQEFDNLDFVFFKLQQVEESFTFIRKNNFYYPYFIDLALTEVKFKRRTQEERRNYLLGYLQDSFQRQFCHLCTSYADILYCNKDYRKYQLQVKFLKKSIKNFQMQISSLEMTQQNIQKIKINNQQICQQYLSKRITIDELYIKVVPEKKRNQINNKRLYFQAWQTKYYYSQPEQQIQSNNYQIIKDNSDTKKQSSNVNNLTIQEETYSFIDLNYSYEQQSHLCD